MNDKVKILILGGTREALELAELLDNHPHLQIITSLAGKTRQRAKIPGEIRIGGFGGTDGLAGFLRENQIFAFIDATHPFAAQMSQNARTASQIADCPLLRLERSAWKPQTGDNWQSVKDLADAADQLCRFGTRALLTVGSNDLAFFKQVTGARLFARMIEKPADSYIPRGCEIILERPPFTLDQEVDLLSGLEIDLLVTKNSGGEMVSAKLQAARQRGIPVLMIERPISPDEQISVSTAPDARDWLEQQFTQSRT